MTKQDLTPSNTTISANDSEVSESFPADEYGGKGTLAYQLSGSGTPEVTLQASFDSGSTWFDLILLESQNKIKSVELSGALAIPSDDRYAPLLRLQISETGGSNSLTIDDVTGYSPHH